MALETLQRDAVALENRIHSLKYSIAAAFDVLDTRIAALRMESRRLYCEAQGARFVAGLYRQVLEHYVGFRSVN